MDSAAAGSRCGGGEKDGSDGSPCRRHTTYQEFVTSAGDDQGPRNPVDSQIPIPTALPGGRPESALLLFTPRAGHTRRRRPPFIIHGVAMASVADIPAGLPQEPSLSHHDREAIRFPHGGWGKQSHPASQRVSHSGLSSAAAAREDGQRSAGVSQQGRRRETKIHPVVVVVGRILREPITVLKHAPPQQQRESFSQRVAVNAYRPDPPPGNALAR
ncbi:hypothetical protein QBC39DRAFT_421391 [Podospora conica]|nr:hypothetical protein QBC39DRAFT_421391 [Schizothecium conicum]